METSDPEYADVLEQAMHNLKWCKFMDFIHDGDENEKAPDRLRVELKKLGYRIESISWEGLTRENT